MLEIIKFVKTDLRLDNFSRTDYYDYEEQQLQKIIDNNNIDIDDNNVEKNDTIQKNDSQLTMETRQEENKKQDSTSNSQKTIPTET